MTLPTSSPSTYSWKRILDCIVAQRYYNVVAPATPKLDGKFVLVTGGAHGIGLGVSRGLVQRGAHVVMCGRNEAEGAAAVAELGARSATFVRLDLADLSGMTPFVNKLKAIGTFSVLVCNAGVAPQVRKSSAQGFELAYATNVLGHHALILAMLKHGVLGAHARGVVTTGDIYHWADDCSEDFDANASSNFQYYSRSKLGNLWQVQQLHKRLPQLEVVAVHPGVVASELSGASAENRSALMTTLTSIVSLTTDEGAQASLFAATQPSVREHVGQYLHNTYGWVNFNAGDPALSPKASAFVDRMEQIVTPFL